VKIRSKFKDYYDFVGKRYGEDPDVVYSRGAIAVGDFKMDEIKIGRYNHNFASSYMKPKQSDPDRTTYALELLVAGELVFPMVRMTTRHSDPYELLGGAWDTVAYRHLDPPTLFWMQGSYRYDGEAKVWKKFQESLASYRPKLREAIVKLNAPVYLYTALGVEPRVPILSEFDIPSRVRPEDMWQNIYSCHTNLLRKNPDKAVPVQLADKDRIVKAGFDLKTSFRNPINPKPKRSKR
jgi:hypothetical protein